MRYLFDRLIIEEIHRDEWYRRDLIGAQRHHGIQRATVPPGIQLPTLPDNFSPSGNTEDDFIITPRAPNGNLHSAATPGLSIGVATPFPGAANHNSNVTSQSTISEDNSAAGKARPSLDKPGDYFSAAPNVQGPSDTNAKGSTTPGDGSGEATTQSPVDADNQEKPKESGLLFGKKFRMNFPKKLGRASTEVKPAVVDEKSEGSEKSEEKEERLVQDSLFGSIQKIRYDYEEHLQNNQGQYPPNGITPCPSSETPELTLPQNTTIIIQEDRPDSGGIIDLYSGTIASAGKDADMIEHTGPMWLGDFLFRV